jgi:low affinity Fe/Cu permease
MAERRPFDAFAAHVARATGSPWAFTIATLACVAWAFTGPLFDYSDTWQLIINTSTTVLTFLMVFVIQNTQNRDTAEMKAMLKEICEDLPDVDEMRARGRVDEEAKRGDSR